MDDDPVIVQGDEGNNLYFVLNGKLSVYKRNLQRSLTPAANKKYNFMLGTSQKKINGLWQKKLGVCRDIKSKRNPLQRSKSHEVINNFLKESPIKKVRKQDLKKLGYEKRSKSLQVKITNPLLEIKTQNY